MAGIYVHIPFCRQACTYCNFHFSVSLENKAKVLDAIRNEIVLTEKFDEDPIETIYFGGGTPSLLSNEELNALINGIRDQFKVSYDAEITLEANPDDINPEILQSWRSVGVNRLSVGLQSFNNAELVWMNRAHNAAQSEICLQQIKEAGFDNYSADLIYGSPLQDDDVLRENIRMIIEAGVPHVSCYALTVEEKTVLHNNILKNKSATTDPERQASQFTLLCDLLEASGYEQYEISNFAKPGYRSKHNSSYWSGKAYYGFGPSAHSFDGRRKRKWNVANNSLYISSLEKNEIPFEEENLTDTQRLNEYIMIGLRRAEGINLEHITQHFGDDQSARILKDCEKFVRENLMMRSGDNLILSKKGKFLADGIAGDLFG